MYKWFIHGFFFRFTRALKAILYSIHTLFIYKKQLEHLRQYCVKNLFYGDLKDLENSPETSDLANKRQKKKKKKKTTIYF